MDDLSTFLFTHLKSILERFASGLETLEAATKSVDHNEKRKPLNAGQPWSKEDDSTLTEMYGAGTSVRELAKHFQRTDGAIQSRLLRLVGPSILAQPSPDAHEGDPGDRAAPES
jgi:hypothetical protein